MKQLGQIVDAKDITNKEYVDSRIEESINNISAEITAQDISTALGYTPANQNDIDILMHPYLLDGTEKTLTVGVDIQVGQVINFQYLKAYGYKITKHDSTLQNLGTYQKAGIAAPTVTYGEDSITIEDIDGYTFEGVYANTWTILTEQVEQNAENIETLSEEIANKQSKGNYALKSELTAETTARQQAIADLEIKMNQLKIKFVKSEAEMTDPEMLYGYDGYIWQYGVHTEEIVTPGETVTIPAKAAVLVGKRYSLSGGAFKDNSGTSAVVVPLPTEITGDVTITLENMSRNTSYGYIYGSATNDKFTTTIATLVETNYTEFVLRNDFENDTYSKVSESSFVTFSVNSTGVSGQYDNSKIFVNGVEVPFEITTDPTIAKQEITTTTEGSTETVETEGFYNSGCAFAPADYEKRIIELESKVGKVDENAVIHNTVGTVFPPLQKPAETNIAGYDIDVLNATADDIYAYIDENVSAKETVTKEILGKDASNTYDVARYTYAIREYIAWVRQNYPKMYAWKNGSTIIYSVSVSPRKNDTLYTTPYVGTAKGTVTAVNATNRSRTVGGVEYVRYESGDIEPTVIYTDIDDERNSNTVITQGGITYNRYPLGDLGANRNKLIPICIIANEHGIYPVALNESHEMYQKYETKMCALVAARMIRDFSTNKQSQNPLYKYIRENCMLIVIPVVNPYGYNLNITNPDTDRNGYQNYNNCNINRNYDCPGWDVMNPNGNLREFGAYVGSENETQYVMNTMVESGAVVAMSLHGLGGWAGYCAHQGQSPDGSDYNREKLAKVDSFLKSNYGYSLRYYDLNNDGTPAVAVNTPDITCKSPSYITQCGAYGGIVEFQPDDVNTSGFMQEMKSNVIENAYAQTLNLMAMWLSDYLEQ